MVYQRLDSRILQRMKKASCGIGTVQGEGAFIMRIQIEKLKTTAPRLSHESLGIEVAQTTYPARYLPLFKCAAQHIGPASGFKHSIYPQPLTTVLVKSKMILLVHFDNLKVA